MFQSLKFYSKKTVPMETGYPAYRDEEVVSIYKAIKNDNTQDGPCGVEEKVWRNKASKKLQNIQIKNEALVQLSLFQHKYGEIEVSDRLWKFVSENDDSLDSLLHTAALFNRDSGVVKLLLKLCPDLRNTTRTGSYKGQTALHITIAKEKIRSTEAILRSLTKHNRHKEEILSAKATGPKFKNNIMMGETVLSVAVLTLNPKILDLLLEYGAPIDQINTKGDTVIHTLIKYAVFIPDKTPEVIQMLKHLNDKIFQIVERYNDEREMGNVLSDRESLIEKMWFGQNNDLMTPLKLAVSAGLIEIFLAMMKLKNVFYFPSNYDGFYDTRYYDITEIDHVAQYQYSKGMAGKASNKTCSSPESVIEILNGVNWKKAQPFVDTTQIKMLISRRWRSHKIPFYIFAFIHVSVMILFTTSVYYRKYVITECNNIKNNCQSAEIYAKVTPWVLVGYSAVIIFSEIYRWTILRQIWRPHKHHNNSWYRVSLFLFASGLILDACLYTWKVNSNDVIFIVIILGFWFLFFFLKGFEKFSVFTVLFQKVIMGDLLRFGLIIGIEFTAYSYAMYIVLRGNGDVEEFSNFENTTLTMFSYMLGFKDLSFLDSLVSVDAKRLVAVIYVLFIISTYILLLNTLIAMMNGTSKNIFKYRKSLTRLQRSTVVQFLDGFFPMPNFKWRMIDNRPSVIKEEKGPTEVSARVEKFRRHRYYLAITIDKIGKLVREKEEKKNLTLKDIKYELLFKRKKPVQRSKEIQPPTEVNDNVKALIESEEPIQSSDSDSEKQFHWLRSLDIEYQS